MPLFSSACAREQKADPQAPSALFLPGVASGPADFAWMLGALDAACWPGPWQYPVRMSLGRRGDGSGTLARGFPCDLVIHGWGARRLVAVCCGLHRARGQLVACVTHITRTCGGVAYDTCLDLFDPLIADMGGHALTRAWMFSLSSTTHRAWHPSKGRWLRRCRPSSAKLDAIDANYHIGLVTTDIGTLPPGSTGFPAPRSRVCNTVTGDDGRLQNLPCSARISTADPGSEFARLCAKGSTPLCADPSFVPSDPWIAKKGTKPQRSAGECRRPLAYRDRPARLSVHCAAWRQRLRRRVSAGVDEACARWTPFREPGIPAR